MHVIMKLTYRGHSTQRYIYSITLGHYIRTCKICPFILTGSHCILTYICIIHVCILGNDEIIYVASNSGGGYTSRVFDNNLGSVDTFILDGIYIYADKVSIYY